jgi:hypothetical protein
MTAFGEVIISGLDYEGGFGTNTSKVPNFISQPVKGDGLVNRSNGQHTVQIITSNLTANVAIEATLNRNPNNAVWIPVQLVSGMDGSSTNNLVFNYLPLVPGIQESGKPIITNKFYTITGKYSWLRANISNISHGRIESIKIAF